MQAPDSMAKIDLISMVRDSVSKLITIENPLQVPVEIKKEMLTVDNDNIFFNPN